MQVEPLDDDDVELQGMGEPGDRYSMTIGFSSNVARQEGKYYYNSDKIKTGHVSNEQEVDDLYAENAVPTVQSLVDSCFQHGFSVDGDVKNEEEEAAGKVIWNIAKKEYQANWFQKGDWVEYRGLDMSWHLAQVRRVVYQAPDSWDYDDNDGEDPPPYLMNVYYSFKEQGLISQDEVRAPKQGLERIFGSGPWLWQQHCLLLLERRLRFQEGHEHDFEEVDIQRFADRRFDDWVNAVGNEDFKKHYLEQPEIAQRLLATHLLTPFELMDQITEDQEAWDFEDDDISVYTYTSVLGSGCSMFLVALMIQIVGIFVLLINGIQTEDGEQNGRFFFDDQGSVYSFLGFELAGTNFTLLCRGGGVGQTRAGLEGKILLFLVIVMYICQIVPDTFQRFYRVAGAYESTHSKINSLREVIWKQADDSLLQQIGYKFDRYMNTAFVCIVYMVLLFILFNTPNVLDIILNALAVEFLHEIDEKLADAEWWDGGNRWIRAGTQQLVIQGTLRLQILETVDRTCAEFDIDKERYKEALGDNYGPLKAPLVAQRDDQSPEYLGKKERLWYQFAEYAKKQGNDQAYKHFRKSILQFGMVEYFLYMLGVYRKGQYHRQIDYRSWSRWERVLYLCHVPTTNLEEDEEDREKSFKLLSKHSQDDMDKELSHVERSDFVEFAVQFLRVFLLIDAAEMMVLSCKVGNFYELPWRVVDSLLEWCSYVIQIIFPAYVLFALAAFPYCY